MFGMFAKKTTPDYSGIHVSLDLDDEGRAAATIATDAEIAILKVQQLLHEAGDRAIYRVMGDPTAPRSAAQQQEIFDLTLALAGDMAQENELTQRLLDSNFDRDRALVNGLDDIKNAIDRSAVAANALDFAMEHPFLTGVLGKAAIDKVFGK